MAAPRVEIREARGGYTLLRGGKPYELRGACAWDFLELLRSCGGNSIRTWGAKDDPLLYEKAHALGLTVCAGLWLTHDYGGGFYNDPMRVGEEANRLLAHVRKYRSHPAILFWAVGNETEIISREKSDYNPNLYRAVENLAKRVKEADPNHPVIAAVGEVTGTKVRLLKEHCPSLDALGVNSYGGLASLPDRLRQHGWTKPYVVTEFGASGWELWDSPTTSWGALIEPDSTRAAWDYLVGYRSAVAHQRSWCLGSYAYLWGVHNQFAYSNTWYHMFLRTGERLAAVQTMQLAWTGKLPATLAPEIVHWESSVGLKEVAPGSEHKALVAVRHPSKVPYGVRWEIEEGMDRPTRQEQWPRKVTDFITRVEDDRLTLREVAHGSLRTNVGMTRIAFTAPRRAGPYRLYVYVVDEAGCAAAGNVPFSVARGRGVSR
ncbi:MAG: glycoside hydrolase family 2 TIM barrel-domain containing protein [Armatimonadota bacterium]